MGAHCGRGFAHAAANSVFTVNQVGTWYNLYNFINEALVGQALTDVSTAAAQQNLPLRTFLIDAGFTPELGDWLDTAYSFQNEIAPQLTNIQQAGFAPGLWIAPFLVGNRSKLYISRRIGSSKTQSPESRSCGLPSTANSGWVTCAPRSIMSWTRPCRLPLITCARCFTPGATFGVPPCSRWISASRRRLGPNSSLQHPRDDPDRSVAALEIVRRRSATMRYGWRAASPCGRASDLRTQSASRGMLASVGTAQRRRNPCSAICRFATCQPHPVADRSGRGPAPLSVCRSDGYGGSLAGRAGGYVWRSYDDQRLPDATDPRPNESLEDATD